VGLSAILHLIKSGFLQSRGSGDSKCIRAPNFNKIRQSAVSYLMIKQNFQANFFGSRCLDRTVPNLVEEQAHKMCEILVSKKSNISEMQNKHLKRCLFCFGWQQHLKRCLFCISDMLLFFETKISHIFTPVKLRRDMEQNFRVNVL